MVRDREEGESYLRMYPHARRWMNQCAVCQRAGYNPELPEAITKRIGGSEEETMLADNLREYFAPLALDAMGLCEMCSPLVTTVDSN